MVPVVIFHIIMFYAHTVNHNVINTIIIRNIVLYLYYGYSKLFTTSMCKYTIHILLDVGVASVYVVRIILYYKSTSYIKDNNIGSLKKH